MIPSFGDVYRCGGEIEIAFVAFWIAVAVMIAFVGMSVAMVRK